MILRVLLAAALFLLVVAGVLAHGPDVVGKYINADTLNPTAFYRDIFVDGYPISRWNLTAAPHFFPDLPLMFALLWAAGPDLGIVHLAYSIIWMLLILLALISVARHVVPDLGTAAISAFAAGAFFVALLLDPHYRPIAQNLFSVVHHGNGFLMSLALLGVVLSGIRWGFPLWRWTTLFVVSTLTIISQFLIVPWFLLPVSLTVILFWVLRWLPARTCLLVLLAAGGACGAALLSISTLQALGVFEWKLPWLAEVPLFDSIQASANPDFLLSWLSLGGRFPALAAVGGVWLLACVGFVAREARHLASSGRPREISTRERLELFLIVFSVLSVSAALLGPISRGWIWNICLRHLHPVFFLPGMVLAIVIAVPRYRGSIHLSRALCGLVVLFALFRIAPQLISLEASQIRQPYLGRVRCVDGILRHYSMEYGYSGNYWDNRYLTILSRSDARVNLVRLPELTAWQMANNPAWYHTRRGGDPGDYPRYEFLIADRESAEKIEQRFGRPAARHACGPSRQDCIFAGAWCEPSAVMIYNRPQDVAFRNRIRIPGSLGRGPKKDPSGMAIHGSTEVPMLPVRANESGIVCAEHHRSYLEDGAEPDAAGAAAVPGDEGLTSRFEAPVTANVLEISAMGRDVYRVDFYLAEQRIGRLDVPETGEKELRIRYLPLPEELTNRPFDRIVITPAGRVGDSRVGHVCFYEDALDD